MRQLWIFYFLNSYTFNNNKAHENPVHLPSSNPIIPDLNIPYSAEADTQRTLTLESGLNVHQIWSVDPTHGPQSSQDDFSILESIRSQDIRYKPLGMQSTEPQLTNRILFNHEPVGDEALRSKRKSPAEGGEAREEQERKLKRVRYKNLVLSEDHRKELGDFFHSYHVPILKLWRVKGLVASLPFVNPLGLVREIIFDLTALYKRAQIQDFYLERTTPGGGLIMSAKELETWLEGEEANRITKQPDPTKSKIQFLYPRQSSARLDRRYFGQLEDQLARYEQNSLERAQVFSKKKATVRNSEVEGEESTLQDSNNGDFEEEVLYRVALFREFLYEDLGGRRTSTSKWDWDTRMNFQTVQQRTDDKDAQAHASYRRYFASFYGIESGKIEITRMSEEQNKRVNMVIASLNSWRPDYNYLRKVEFKGSDGQNQPKVNKNVEKFYNPRLGWASQVIPAFIYVTMLLDRYSNFSERLVNPYSLEKTIQLNSWDYFEKISIRLSRLKKGATQTDFLKCFPNQDEVYQTRVNDIFCKLHGGTRQSVLYRIGINFFQLWALEQTLKVSKMFINSGTGTLHRGLANFIERGTMFDITKNYGATLLIE